MKDSSSTLRRFHSSTLECGRKGLLPNLRKGLLPLWGRLPGVTKPNVPYPVTVAARGRVS